VIVLDTHIWYRWVTPADPLPVRVQSLIAQADAVAVSAISIWEIARLAQRGRVDLKRDILAWLPIALGGAGIDCLPITESIHCFTDSFAPGSPSRSGRSVDYLDGG
jgi:PIN domain nuclease of toxin-antitoxin system